MELPPPLTRPLDLVLHLGMGKTGTSSIQFFLRDHRDALAALGTLYPETPGGGRHQKLGLSVKTRQELDRSIEWTRVEHGDPGRFRRRFRKRLLTEIEDSGLSRVLLSDEVLFGSSPAALRRLGSWTSGLSRSRRVVVYLRRQDDHMVSRYQEEVKLGEVRRLDAWSRQRMRRLYDYHDRLCKIQQLLAPTSLVVRRFERDRFPGGSVLQDFLEAAGLDTSLADLSQGEERNTALDADSLEFLRLLNVYRVEHESAVPGRIEQRDVAHRLAHASSGPTLTLPPAYLDRFMSRWARPNEAVAREFLGDPSGVLFQAPRKSSNITAEQRLDPARVEHFVRVAGLPDDLLAPLRATAEREAVAR
jgi:hypothetical protein